MTAEQAQTSALLSIMDVVEELSFAVGERPWAAVVRETFDRHRAELREAEYGPVGPT